MVTFIYEATGLFISNKVGNSSLKVGNIDAILPPLSQEIASVNSLITTYLNKITFTADQVSTLRLLGEYRGKQELFFRQSPEILNSLRLVAKIESSESSNRLEGIELPHKKINVAVPI